MRARIFGAAIAVSLGAGVFPATAAVNLIQNGGFEDGLYVDGGPGFETLPAGNPSITSWTIGGNSIDWIGTYWQPGDGVHSIDLSGNALGSVSQSFAAVVGQQYTVSFLLAGNPDGPPTTKDVNVNVNGSNQDFFFPLASATHANMNWTPVSFNFIANSSTEILTFSSVTCGGDVDNRCAFGPALDAVSVTSAVPELSTWGMMLFGFAGVGFVAYLRSRKSPMAAAII